jgi:UDP-glucose 4-epimerase
VTSLDGARVMITGGVGLIGSTIADQLLDRGVDHIVVLDNMVRGRLENLAPALDSGRVTLEKGDIRDLETVQRTMTGCDVVFHQAAIRITQCAEEPRLAFEVLAEGSFNVIETAATLGVGKVVAASSASVYGLAQEFPTSESHHPYDNRTLYGAAKVFNEGVLRAFHDTHGLDYVALRYFNVYGPRMDIHGVYTEVLVRWMERIASGQPPLILGDGTTTMDFVYIDDIAGANLAAATSNATDAVFNVASGVETSLNALAETLLKVMGRPDLRPEYGPERRVNSVPRRLAETRNAEAELGFRAEVGLEDGLGRMVEWWQREQERIE